MLHRDLDPKRWFALTIYEQLANIGSEIERAIKWKPINKSLAEVANFRALELFDLTLQDKKHGRGVKEIARARELWLDFFLGENQYAQTEALWHTYVMSYTKAAAILRGSSSARIPARIEG